MFSEEFEASRGAPIDVDGRRVHAVYRRPVKDGNRFVLRWVRAAPSPVQGVSLSAKGGRLRVNTASARDIVVWKDNTPDEIAFVCEGHGIKELEVWNCWKDERGTTHAWLGNAGMLIEEVEPGVLRLRCNSRSDITFDDLVFELQSDRAR